MIDFDYSKQDIFIKLFPVFMYVSVKHGLLIEFGLLNACFTLHLGIDGSVWDD